MWYFNAGESPTQNILNQRPHLVHRVRTDFGVENLSDKIYKVGIWIWVSGFVMSSPGYRREAAGPPLQCDLI